MKQSNCIIPGGEFRNYDLWRDVKNCLPVLFGGLLYYYTHDFSNFFRYVGIAALVTGLIGTLMLSLLCHPFQAKDRNGDKISDGDIEKKDNAEKKGRDEN